MSLVILFFLVFAFEWSLVPIIKSNHIAAIYLLFNFLFISHIRRNTIKILKKTKIAKIFFMLTLLIVYSISVTSFKGQYDWSFSKTLINQMIIIFSICIYYAKYKPEKKEAMDQIILIFVIQSIIQLSSMVFPQINLFFNQFRSENAILKGQEGYGGIRGLSISGSSFFGLATGYGVVYMLYFYRNKLKKKNKKDIMFLFLMLIGGFSAGRTSLVGFFFSLIYVVISRSREIIKRKKVSYKIFSDFIIVFFSVVAFIKLFLYLRLYIPQFQTLYNFVMQPIINYKKINKLTTSSTRVLFRDMYFFNELSFNTLLLGDGRFSGDTTSYYMGTDAGYMRFILYFGVPGLILMSYYQLLFVSGYYDKLFSALLYALLMVFHVKGVVLGFGLMTQTILFYLHVNNYLVVENTSKYRWDKYV